MGVRQKPVELTNRAIRDLLKYKKFCYELYGQESTMSIINKVFEKIKTLENPEIDLTKIGAIDESFLHLKHQYRKLTLENLKITYRIGHSKIYVVRIFDTRQNPAKNR